MKKLVLLSAVLLVAISTTFAQDGKPKKLRKSKSRYHQCDAYKTQYAPLKPERHHNHGLCDAYNWLE